MEHFAKEKLEANFAKLPGPVQSAVLGSLKVAFAGWTASQALAERVAEERGATVEEAKALRGVLASADLLAFKPASIGLPLIGAGAVSTAMWAVPPVTGAYLLYSAARNPVATYRAAHGLVKEALARHTDVLNVFCATGEGGGVDPTCSSSENKAAIHAALKTIRKAAGDFYNYSPDAGKSDIISAISQVTWKNPEKAVDLVEQLLKRGFVYTHAEETKALKQAVAKLDAFIHASKGFDWRPNEMLPEDYYTNAANTSVADAFVASGYSDWWFALFAAAGAEIGDEARSVALADRLSVTHNSFCSTGPGGGVDPTCSPTHDVEAVIRAMPTAAESDEKTQGRGREVPNIFKIPSPDEVKVAFKKLIDASNKRGKAGTEVVEVEYQPERAKELIHSTQKNLAEASLLYMVSKEGDKKLPDAFQMDGKLYLRDGNHRTAAAVLSEKPVTLRVAHIKSEPIINVLVVNPAVSEAQRRFLNAHFGHDWVKEHEFDNRGELPEHVENSFCPTGPGGGVDPSCSRGPRKPTKISSVISLHKPNAESPYVLRHRREGDLVYISVERDGDELHIADIRTPEGSSDESANTLGVKVVKATLAAIIADHPGVKRVTGTRAFGRRRGGEKTDVVVNRRDFQFMSTPQQLEAFKRWLSSHVQGYLTDEEMWQKYAEAGFRKGAGRAFDDTRASVRARVSRDEELAHYHGSREEFLRTSFGQPEAVEKIQLLASRSFDDLTNVTTDMSTRMSRTLVDGLTQGKGAGEIAKDLGEDVDIAEGRAQTIARTEIIRAHAEGQLLAFEKLGVQELGVQAEWSTAGDDRVCEECGSMEGTVVQLEDAKGLIPMHPNCRCTWIPSTTSEEVTSNVFCPTGEGGGVDPSCGKLDTKEVEHLALSKEGQTYLRKIAARAKKHGDVFYHGTSVAALESIREHGLEPAGGPGATDFLVKTFSGGETADKEERAKNVYLTTSKLSAVQFANLAEGATGTRSVVVVVHIPKDQSHRLTRDEYAQESMKAQKFEGRVPPEWIHGALVQTTTNVEHTVGYAVVLYKEPTENQFCPTGEGGGVDATCSSGNKFVGQKVGWRERERADAIEKETAKALGLQHESDYKFYDAKSADDKHFVEVKSALVGSKQSINAHPDALLRKVEGMQQYPGATYHTVFHDEREGEAYSGHGLYYKRGNGRYSIGQMHPVKSYAELRRLMRAPDAELPEKARGSLPSGREAQALKKLAAAASESRKGRDAARREKAKREGRSVYERRT